MTDGLELVSQPEAAALLGLTTSAIAYIAKVRRLLTRRRRNGQTFYSLREVEALRRQRAGQKKIGRPSGQDLLRRRAVHVPKMAHILKELAECQALEAART
jgi:hypothetical protein